MKNEKRYLRVFFRLRILAQNSKILFDGILLGTGWKKRALTNGDNPQVNLRNFISICKLLLEKKKSGERYNIL